MKVNVLRALGVLALVSFFAVQAAIACGPPPRPPICGKTVVLAKAGPVNPVLVDSAQNESAFIDAIIPVFVYVGNHESPPGACGGAIPSGVATITLTVECADGFTEQFQSTTALEQGNNETTVAVTVPNKAQICTITAGSVTVNFNDGMSITSGAGRSTTFCVFEAIDLGNGPVPRLELTQLNTSVLGNPIHRVHPGHQAVPFYRITNNDPVNSFSGTIGVGIQSSHPQPIDNNPPFPGFGVYSPGDPFGDSFPMAFVDRLPEGFCPPLLPDPHLQGPAFMDRVINLAPGESIEIGTAIRPWGRCLNGSCAESIINVDGVFSDATQGIACTTAVIVSDNTQLPSSFCPGAGIAPAIGVDPMFPVNGLFQAQIINPEDPFAPPIGLQIGMQMVQQDLLGQPVGQPFFILPTAPLQQMRGQFCSPLPPQVDLVGGSTTFGFSPGPESAVNFDTELLSMELVSGGPTGFSDVAPYIKGTVGIDIIPQGMAEGDGQNDAFFDFLAQLTVSPYEGACPPSDQSPPMFSGQMLPVQIDPLFTDGFESGDTVAWSATVSRGLMGPTSNAMILWDVQAYVRIGDPPPPCAEDVVDLNGDFLFNEADLNTLYPLFDQAASDPQDTDGDGLITMLDLVDFANFGNCQVYDARPVTMIP